jgi:hypothetical protein
MGFRLVPRGDGSKRIKNCRADSAVWYDLSPTVERKIKSATIYLVTYRGTRRHDPQTCETAKVAAAGWNIDFLICAPAGILRAVRF